MSSREPDTAGAEAADPGAAPSSGETSRLLLERLGPEHAEVLLPVLGDSRVWTHVGGSDGASVEQMREDYARRARGPARSGERWWNFAVRLRDGGVIGRLEASVHAEGWAEIGYLLGVEFHGRGLGREAVGWLLDALPVDEVWATVRPENARSRRLLDVLGFVVAEPRAELASWEPGDLAYRRIRR